MTTAKKNVKNFILQEEYGKGYYGNWLRYPKTPKDRADIESKI